MVWTGYSTLSHNKWCGHSVIDGVLESYLNVIIDYNLLCIRVFINQASILIEDTMVIRVEGSRNLLSREDFQCVSRVWLAECWQKVKKINYISGSIYIYDNII